MTNQPPTPAPPEHLPLSAYRTGMRVEVINPAHIAFGRVGAIGGIDARFADEGEPEVLFMPDARYGDYERLRPDDVRPVLRKLETLSETEARECFRLAFGYVPDRFKMQLTTPCTLCLYSELMKRYPEQLVFHLTRPVLTAGRYNRGTTLTPTPVNARAVFAYLESLFFDVDNYIPRHLALDAAEVAGKQERE